MTDSVLFFLHHQTIRSVALCWFDETPEVDKAKFWISDSLAPNDEILRARLCARCCGFISGLTYKTQIRPSLENCSHVPPPSAFWMLYKIELFVLFFSPGALCFPRELSDLLASDHQVYFIATFTVDAQLKLPSFSRLQSRSCNHVDCQVTPLFCQTSHQWYYSFSTRSFFPAHLVIGIPFPLMYYLQRTAANSLNPKLSTLVFQMESLRFLSSGYYYLHEPHTPEEFSTLPGRA